MPQFLFVVEVAASTAMSSSAGYSSEWHSFESEANTMLKTVKACKRLQLNAWLLPAENTLPVLVALSALAHGHTLSYSSVLIPDGAVMLALDEKPKANPV